MSLLDPNAILESMIDLGACEGTRVTFNILPTETVRAAEITETQSLRKKVAIYAEASGQEVSEEILDMADNLETMAREAGETGSGLHIEIQKLILRGSIGIWKGQKKDEVCLDFSQYDEGLIALIGVNGAGKTTLIENMHPWPQMLTREGKLQDHFRLRDSSRDLYFKDSSTGIEYRALLNIDGKNASGSVEYFLYQKNGVEWEPLSGINGRKEPYVEWINKIFGSLRLYLLSAFSTQRPSKSAPDIASAVKGEKRALFAELSGIEYLQMYSESAKHRAKQLDSIISEKNGMKTAYEQQLETQSNKRQVLKEMDNEISSIAVSIDELNKERKIADADFRHAEETQKYQESLKNDIDHLQKRMEIVGTELGAVQTEQKEYADALKGKEQAEKAIKEWEVLDARYKELTNEKQKQNEEFQKRYSEWADSAKIIGDTLQQIRGEISPLEKAKTALEADRSILVADIERIESELLKPINDKCPTCDQTWPEQKLQEYRKAREQKKEDCQKKIAKLDHIDADFQKVSDELDALEKKLAEVPEVEDAPINGKFSHFEELNKVEMDLEWIDIDKERETLEKSKEAQVRSEELNKRIASLDEELSSLRDDYKGKQKHLDPEVAERYQQSKATVEQLQNEIHSAETNQASLRARRDEIAEQIKAFEETKQKLKTLKSEINDALITQDRWKFLQMACGRDGIQALELDAVAPNICEIANRLLSAAYGSRFQIEIRTTREAGKGSKVKQVEDFNIWILDTENMDEQTLDTLSGGEVVWIRKALYDAFGIIRARNTGMNFLTVFLDEADGALDPEAREHYFRMLEAAHTESGRRHTILITHSREIQEIINQRIDICSLAAIDRPAECLV